MELWAESFSNLHAAYTVSPWLRPLDRSEQGVIQPLAEAAKAIRLRGHKVQFEIGTDWVPHEGDRDWTGSYIAISRLWGTAYYTVWHRGVRKRINRLMMRLSDTKKRKIESRITQGTCSPELLKEWIQDGHARPLFARGKSGGDEDKDPRRYNYVTFKIGKFGARPLIWCGLETIPENNLRVLI